MVARVYFDCFVNKTARPYILFMSKTIDQSLFAFYCTKPFLFSDRPPESNEARLTYALQLSQHFRPRLTTRMVITVNRALRTPAYTDTSLPPTQTSLFQRKCALKGRWEGAYRLYSSHSPLQFITSHSRFALASAKRKTKRLRRRLDTSLLRAVSFVLWRRKPLRFLLFQPALKYGRTKDTYFLRNQQIFVESRPPYKLICRRPFQTYFYIKRFIQRTVLIK